MSLGGDDGKAGAAGVLHQPRLEPRLKAGLRLRRCQPGTQPAEDLHPARWTVEDVVDAGHGLRVHGRGHPQIGHGADVDAAKAFGRHTHDRHGVVVDRDLAADDIGSAPELRLPEPVREHDDRTGTGDTLVGRFKHAAERGPDAEDREVAAGDELRGDGPWIAAGRERHGTELGAADDALEDTALMLHVAAERVRHQVVGAKATRHMFAFPVDEDQALGLADRERVQDQLIDKGVDGRRGADAERERQQCGGGEARAAAEGSDGKAEIVEEVPPPAAEPHVSNVLAH